MEKDILMKIWYDQISSFKKLKINEAQELYKKAISTENESLRKEYMDGLVLGTLYVVYDYVKRNELMLFVSPSYDINDIINSFNEAWIKKIYNGELLKVDRYSLLFTSTIFNETYKNMGVEEINVNEQFKVSSDCFIELLSMYIKYRNCSTNEPFEKIIERDLYNSRKYPYMSFFNSMKLIPFLEKIYNSLNFDKNDDLNLVKTKIDNYLRLIISNGLVEKISSDTFSESDIETDVIRKITYEHLIEDVDKTIKNRRAREIIHERFGLDNGQSMLLEDVGKKHGISRERTRQIEEKTLRLLRFNKKLKKYREEIL